MEPIAWFKLFYHRTGYIAVGKFEEEDRNVYTKGEAEDLLEKVLDLLTKGGKVDSWGFSFNVYASDGQMWSVERKQVDREERTFTVIYSKQWNITDAPRRMRRSDIIKDILAGIEKGVK